MLSKHYIKICHEHHFLISLHWYELLNHFEISNGSIQIKYFIPYSKKIYLSKKYRG